jgi:methionyl-tRNA formyltransferase
MRRTPGTDLTELATPVVRRKLEAMVIAFFGLPLAALLLLEDGHDVALAVLSRTDVVGVRRLSRLLGPSRLLARGDLPEAAVVERVRAEKPDLLVSWFWTQKLPTRAIEAARHGGVGVHPSLLPRHRGPDPYFAAIDGGDAVTGVTAHRLDGEYDTGAILGSVRVDVDPRWNAWQLARKLDAPSLRLLRDVVMRIGRGEELAAHPQDESLATWAPAPTDDDCALQWSWPAARLLRRIRALAPSPGAFTEIDGQLVTIHAAEPAASFPRALVPGEAAVIEGRAVVRTGDSALVLVSGEIDGLLLDGSALGRIVAHATEKVIL